MLEVVDKLFNILELFLKGNNRYTISEVVELSGYDVATTHRILTKLVQRGYLDKVKGRKGYRLGPNVFDFKRYSINKAELRRLVEPFLIDLSKYIDETIVYLDWDTIEFTRISIIPSVHPLRVILDDRPPLDDELYHTAAGKAMLANMTDSKFNAYCRTVPMKAYTPNTITDLNELKHQILLIRQEGIAYNFGEHHKAVNSQAAAVKNSEGSAVGALVVIGPSARLTRLKMREFAPELKKTAAEISKKMGY